MSGLSIVIEGDNRKWQYVEGDMTKTSRHHKMNSDEIKYLDAEDIAYSFKYVTETSGRNPMRSYLENLAFDTDVAFYIYPSNVRDMAMATLEYANGTGSVRPLHESVVNTYGEIFTALYNNGERFFITVSDETYEFRDVNGADIKAIFARKL